MDFKKINPLWHLADSLTIHQAAALIAGADPHWVVFCSDGGIYFEDGGLRYVDEDGNVGTAFSAIKSAIISGKLQAKIIYDSRPIDDADHQHLIDLCECGEYFNPGYANLCADDEIFCNDYFVKKNPNWGETMVNVDEIRKWLAGKGITTGFFFAPSLTNAPDYLDPQNPRYAPKLAAAVSAWQAVTDPVGKHPKQALAKWLREHAVEFDLTDGEGKPNETGIEEVAKVANWQLTGGAAKTPGK